MTAGQLIKKLADFDRDLTVVHPGQAGDIYVETVYVCELDNVLVISDRRASSANGSETGREYVKCPKCSRRRKLRGSAARSGRRNARGEE